LLLIRPSAHAGGDINLPRGTKLNVRLEMARSKPEE